MTLTSLVTLFVAIVTPLVIFASSDGWMWAACLLVLPLLFWLCGGRDAPRVLLFVLGVAWLQIAGNVLLADLNGVSLAETELGVYIKQAILYSLFAILVIAFGMRCGLWSGGKVFGVTLTTDSGESIAVSTGGAISRLVICYAACAVFTQNAFVLASFVPGSVQLIIAFGLLKFVCIYLIAAAVLGSGRGYPWLILVTGIEVITGMMSFFSHYKDAIFIILIAAASIRRSPGMRTWIFASVAVVGVIWLSLVWTIIKNEYREIIYDMNFEQRVSYIISRYAEGVEYGDALVKLFERIEYTTFLAYVIAQDDAGGLAENKNYYGGALLHVVTPRLFFPNKASLSDLQKTTELLGISIADDTSIGIGFVAESYVDFGFPGLLVPMFFIGCLLGFAARYFMTRSAPLLVREAFAASALFFCFKIEFNIDKTFGAFITSWIVLALTLKFIYPMVGPWLFRAQAALGPYGLRAPITLRD